MCLFDSNALKFTPSGGCIQVKSCFIPTIESASVSSGSIKPKASASRVHVTSAAADNTFGKIRIEFFDTGPGISEVNSFVSICFRLNLALSSYVLMWVRSFIAGKPSKAF